MSTAVMVRGFIALAVATGVLAAGAPAEAGAASARLKGRASPGQKVTLKATGLQAGSQVLIAVLPQMARRDRGVIVGRPHVVPASGNLTLRFRWPRAYHICPVERGGSCSSGHWRNGRRVHVLLGGPDQESSTGVAAATSIRVRVGRARSRKATSNRGAAVQAAAVPTGYRECGGYFVAAARASGEGYGARISLVPTRAANLIARVPPLWDEVWKELFSRCKLNLPGTDGEAMESLKQQLDCHVVGAGFPGIGPTWDLEAWRRNVPLIQLVLSRSCFAPIREAAANAYDGWIVHWSDDPKGQKTAWLVVRRGAGLVRNWIPTADIFNCLKRRGHSGPIALHSDYLTEAGLRDEGGVHASCSSPAPPPQSPPPPQPEPEPQPQPPTSRQIVVDNRVTNGPSQMREDTPAYLSTVTRNYCKRDGCALPGTDVGSGAVLTAECTTLGNRTTNGQDNSAIDDGNPGLYSSTRWYGIRWGDGRFGYISEVWISAGHRGGLGLRAC